MAGGPREQISPVKGVESVDGRAGGMKWGGSDLGGRGLAAAAPAKSKPPSLGLIRLHGPIRTSPSDIANADM